MHALKSMSIRMWAVMAVTLGLLALWAGCASADSGLASASVELSDLRAGAHPDLTTHLLLNQLPDLSPERRLRDVRVSIPPGFWGAPASFPTCTEGQVASSKCPAAAQVGVLRAYVWLGFWVAPLDAPLYNVVAPPGSAAEFGANTYAFNAYLQVKLRSDDYGLDTVSLSIPALQLSLVGVDVTLWGVPGDSSHDGQRFGQPFSGPRVPFMTNPAYCDRPLTTTLAADFWDDPGNFTSQQSTVGPLIACDAQPPVHAALTGGPSGTAADEPAGQAIDLHVDQNNDPDGIATPTIKDVKIQFPQGVSISPAAAHGLQSCTDAQLAAGTDTPVSCPDASKVGSVAITTPALAEPLEGAMYLGQPEQGHPYRLFLVASGPGVTLKLRGEAVVDPATGQVTTMFHDTPALPFSDMNVQLKGGADALLSNPPSCGTYTTTATLTPYGGGPDAVATQDVTISADGEGAPCPATTPFAPSLSAGVLNRQAGAASTFRFRLRRDDRNGLLGSIASVHLPAGLIANVKSVPLCGEADAAAGTCPEATRVGHVSVGSGAGTDPLYLPGSVYLTGPYKGAPFGLSIVVNAITGPYDLGTVNVRAAVQVNPDASLSVSSDPLPTILQGIPLRLRDIVMDFDRPGFMLNPTSCDPATITATAVSTDGAQAALSNPFHLIGCSSLGFKPKLTMALGRRSKAGTTSLRAHIATRPGDAHPRKVVVKLPWQVTLDLKNAQVICKAADYAARSCPAGSIVGHASVSSILKDPLSGPVYFVEGDAKSGSGLPRLWVPLSGDGVTIDLLAQSSLEGSRIVTTFDNIPDVPFSTFDLSINGGSHGILLVSKGACAGRVGATALMDGYNGKIHDGAVKVTCGSKRAAARHRSKR